MILRELGLVIPTEPHNTIQSAVTAASVPPGFAVWIPAWYTGPDTYTNPSNIPIFDMRGAGTTFLGTFGQLITSYDGLTLAGLGFMPILANIRTTGIVANQGATNFLGTTPPAGTYLVVASIVVTTTFTTTGPLLTLGYTDSVGAQSSVAIPATAVGAGSSGNCAFVIQSTGAAQITYAVTSAGTFGAVELNTTLLRIA